MKNNLLAAQNAVRTFAEMGVIPNVPSTKIGNARFQGCCYNPVSNRITIARNLLEKMPHDAMRTMLAHEVGHARQRKQILSSLFRMMGIPLILMLVALVTLPFIPAKNSMTSLGLLIACFAVVAWHINSQEKAFFLGIRLREDDADDFAARCTGDYQNVIDVLNLHNAINGTTLNEEAKTRIARMEKLRGDPLCKLGAP